MQIIHELINFFNFEHHLEITPRNNNYLIAVKQYFIIIKIKIENYVEFFKQLNFS